MDTPAKPDDLSDMGPSPFELELYGSLTNALNVLRGSAPSAIVWSIVRGLNPFPQNIAYELHADLRLRFRRVAAPLLVNILKVRIFTGMSTMPPSSWNKTSLPEFFNYRKSVALLLVMLRSLPLHASYGSPLPCSLSHHWLIECEATRHQALFCQY